MLAPVNSNSGATVIVSYVVVNSDSSIITDSFIAIDNNPLTVRNLTGVGLVFVADIILIVIKKVIVHKNLDSRAPVTVGTAYGNAARVIGRPKGVVMDDIAVDGNIIPCKHYSLPRTIRDGVVAYYNVMNTAAAADAVSVCSIVIVWCGLRLTDSNALGVAEDRETIDNDIGGPTGRVPDLDAVPGGAVL